MSKRPEKKQAVAHFSIGDIVALAEPLLTSFSCGVIEQLDSENATVLSLTALAQGVHYHICCSTKFLREQATLVSAAERTQRPDWFLSLYPELGRVLSFAKLAALRAELAKNPVH